MLSLIQRPCHTSYSENSGDSRSARPSSKTRCCMGPKGIALNFSGNAESAREFCLYLSDFEGNRFILFAGIYCEWSSGVENGKYFGSGAQFWFSLDRIWFTDTAKELIKKLGSVGVAKGKIGSRYVGRPGVLGKQGTSVNCYFVVYRVTVGQKTVPMFGCFANIEVEQIRKIM